MRPCLIVEEFLIEAFDYASESGVDSRGVDSFVIQQAEQAWRETAGEYEFADQRKQSFAPWILRLHVRFGRGMNHYVQWSDRRAVNGKRIMEGEEACLRSKVWVCGPGRCVDENFYLYPVPPLEEIALIQRPDDEISRGGMALQSVDRPPRCEVCGHVGVFGPVEEARRDAIMLSEPQHAEQLWRGPGSLAPDRCFHGWHDHSHPPLWGSCDITIFR